MGANVNQNNEKHNRDYRKMTRKKHFSEHLAYQLFYQNPNSMLNKGYQSTIYCSKELFPNQEGGLSAKRCKQRWCPLCQSIRIMKLIKGYSPALSAMEEPYFVTLTAKTVCEDELDNRIKQVKNFWRYVARDRGWRKVKPKGIRKTECTIRPEGKYHYHQHIIINGKENAELLQKLWFRFIGDKDIVKKKAQDIREVRKGEYIELFKYFTKLVAYDKTAKKKKRYIDFERLNVIFEHIRGSRVYQPFGGVKAVNEDIEDYSLIAQDEENKSIVQRVWAWATNVGYVDIDSGEILTGDYKLPDWVSNVCGNIDKSLTEH